MNYGTIYGNIPTKENTQKALKGISGTVSNLMDYKSEFVAIGVPVVIVVIAIRWIRKTSRDVKKKMSGFRKKSFSGAAKLSLLHRLPSSSRPSTCDGKRRRPMRKKIPLAILDITYIAPSYERVRAPSRIGL